MKDIVVICPIENIYTNAKKAVQAYRYDNVEILYGNMSHGVKVAVEAVASGAKIIVSRGGTYHLIKGVCTVPVVEIKVDAYDIIESYEKLDHDVNEIGVVGYNNVIYGFDILKRLIPKKIHTIELKQEKGVYEIISYYAKKGVYDYIGDANIIPIIQQLGCNGVVIQSREETILTAIQEARRILSATKDEKERTQWLITMTDFIHDGVIAINTDELITIFNKRAESIFNIKKENAIGYKISDVIENTLLPSVLKSGKPDISQLQKIGDISITTNRLPITVEGDIKGAVSTFQEVTEVQRLERKIRREFAEKGFFAKYTFEDIIYKSEAIKNCIETAKTYAEYNTPVHIYGSSGVGKELFCQSIHNSSSRSKGPFVAVNCAAIAPTLIESEFFGYAEGSFTGASKNGKPGIFELAHEGTLFLDEISELPFDLQSRLLRVLQEKQVMRVGGSKMISVDVRIITASNRDLKKMIQDSSFRRDLYYRINILSMHIPDLNQRKEDIPPLSELFLEKYSKMYNRPKIKLNTHIKNLLMTIDYQGNVRELEGIIEKSVILSSFDHLEKEIAETESKNKSYPLNLHELEMSAIHQALEKENGNMEKASKLLGISRATLWRKLQAERSS